MIVSFVIISNKADAKCTGRFVDPIGDICWECMFPITLGSMELIGGDMPDTNNPDLPICILTLFIVGEYLETNKSEFNKNGLIL